MVKLFSQSSRDDLVNCDFGSCSKTEMKELKDKFILHAERIKRFIEQIEAGELELDRIEDAELRKRGNFVEKSCDKMTGLKRTMEVSSDRETKRSKSMDLNSTETRKLEAAMMRNCGAVLNKLMNHKHGWVFNKPVDVVALKIPDYYQIVKCPMDFGTVKSKLERGVYETPLDFAKDVRLTFYNAMLYNRKGDAVHRRATVLLDIFEKLFDSAYEKYEVERQCGIVEHRKIGKPLAGVTKDDAKKALRDGVPPVKTLDTKIGEQPVKRFISNKQRTVPELKENPRMRGNMSDWEKDQLVLVLQNLVEEHVDEILQIVAKRNSKMITPDADGEVELDFQALDNETLWDLHRFARLISKAE